MSTLWDPNVKGEKHLSASWQENKIATDSCCLSPASVLTISQKTEDKFNGKMSFECHSDLTKKYFSDLLEINNFINNGGMIFLCLSLQNASYVFVRI